MEKNDHFGISQRWIAERYAANARFVSELGEPLIDLLDPLPGERILDVGCGDGALTEKLFLRGVEVIGVDSAKDQVAAARRRGIDALVLDAHCLPFQDEFDGIISNAALHWMSRDPIAVIQGMWKALKPGGRLVGEMGGTGNITTIIDALSYCLKLRGQEIDRLLPWYFPEPKEYSEKLRSVGFQILKIELINRPTKLPGHIASWLETFAEPFLMSVPSGERSRFIQEVVRELAPKIKVDEFWIVDYVRLRFSALKSL